MTSLSLKSQSRGLGLSPRRRGAPDGGGGPPGDTEAPSVPQNLSATAVSDDQIDLSWDPSTDNVGVTGYNIYRDDVLIDTSPTNAYADTGLAPGTEYDYEVSAFDAAANESARSAPDSASTHQVIVTAGLIAEWRFDEGAGQVLTDHTGNGHHGQLGSTTGADAADPAWTAQGLSFDGGDFVEIGDGAGIEGGVARSFLAVVKTSAAKQFGFEWRGDPFNTNFERWAVRRGSGDTVRLEVQGFGFSSGLAIPASTWIFVGGTQSGADTNTAVLYLDGASQAVTGSATCITDGPIWFGSEQSATVPMEAAYGLVYNRALSPAEVEQNRQALKSILAARGITLP